MPKASCGPGARPETAAQGRVPGADYASGRVDRGYRCNATPVGRFGATGGFKVQRYVDRQGNACAYYDSTALLPKDVLAGLAGPGLGVVGARHERPGPPAPDRHLVTTDCRHPRLLSSTPSAPLGHESG